LRRLPLGRLPGPTFFDSRGSHPTIGNRQEHRFRETFGIVAVSAVQHNKVRLYQTKTGEHVHVPIPVDVAKALHARDIFAVALLKKGVSLETVSILLGYRSIKITQKHYSPWAKTWQEALEKEVFRALEV
jgi:hypothetical protein